MLAPLRGDSFPKSLAFQELHGDERSRLVFGDLVDGADIGMIQSRGCARLLLETLQSYRVLRQLVWKKLKCDPAAELQILGLVDYSHATATEHFEDAVVRD